MTIIKAVVRQGRLEADEPIDLPDGTELLIPLSPIVAEDEVEWDNTPEGIAAWLKWDESMQPLKITEDQEAEAWLKQCDQIGKASMEKGIEGIFP